MSRTTYGRGSMSVVVDDHTEELIDQVLDRVAPGLRQIVEGTVRALHDDAKRAWPVGVEKKYRKGVHSKDKLGWQLQIEPDGQTVRGRVFCTAAWARYIKPKGLSGRTAFIVYLRKPLQKQAKKLTAELGKYVTREFAR